LKLPELKALFTHHSRWFADTGLGLRWSVGLRLLEWRCPCNRDGACRSRLVPSVKKGIWTWPS